MIVTDLQHAPEHFDTVADRIWRAWWEPDGDALSELVTALRDVVSSKDFPFTLVATDDDNHFLGTVTAIQSDISDRPDLGPCIAALWVDTNARGRGVAAALIEAALARFVAQGVAQAYLAAKPHLHDYYAPRGWTLVARGVGNDSLDIFVRALP